MSLCAKLFGVSFALGFHAGVNRLQNLNRQVSPADADVGDAYADLRSIDFNRVADVAHNFGSLLRKQLLQRNSAENFAHRRVNDFFQFAAGNRFCANRLVKLERINDFVTGKTVDVQTFFVVQNHFLRRWIQIQQTGVVEGNVLNKRNLELQPRFLDQPHRLAELQDNCLFGLIDDINRICQYKQQSNKNDADVIFPVIVHYLLSCV